MNVWTTLFVMTKQTAPTQWGVFNAIVKMVTEAMGPFAKVRKTWIKHEYIFLINKMPIAISSL